MSRDISQALRHLVDRHRLDLVSLDGRELVRHGDRAGMFYRLRSRPWLHQVELNEQDLLLTNPAETIDMLRDSLSEGAASLRGAILRDLIDNMNDYPIDIAGNGNGNADEFDQRCERIGTRLLSLVDRIGVR